MTYRHRKFRADAGEHNNKPKSMPEKESACVVSLCTPICNLLALLSSFLCLESRPMASSNLWTTTEPLLVHQSWYNMALMIPTSYDSECLYHRIGSWTTVRISRLDA
ncbi:hypothetical protein RJT34_30747 [Clitoria ternatea]|uniref:Uncharacterized protein n=1 Tax=Clitoria ternatea TaxID=43366 RepID=A0AAN9ET10_CLITE